MVWTWTFNLSKSEPFRLYPVPKWQIFISLRNEIYKRKFLKFFRTWLFEANSSLVTYITVSHVFFRTHKWRLFVCSTFQLEVSVRLHLLLEILSSPMCKMIFLFYWWLYRDRFKCFSGTPIHPHFQRSPMASSPFTVPREKKTCHCEPWPHPDPHPLSTRKPNTCLNN